MIYRFLIEAVAQAQETLVLIEGNEKSVWYKTKPAYQPVFLI